MDFANPYVRALALAAVWITVIIGVQFALGFALERYERHLARYPDERAAARRRTIVSLVPRLVHLFLLLVAAWSVLSVFPETAGAAGAVLASGAVLALILGIALTDPLGNLGSGIMLVLTQPARLDDRITVYVDKDQSHTGTVNNISISYTTLITDEGRKIFVPNRAMVKNVVINHSRGDRRRAVSVRLPVHIDAVVDDACRIAFAAACAVEEETGHQLELRINVTDITETAIWLDIAGFVPASADVASIATDIRKRALAGLAERELLPLRGRKAA